MLKSELIQRISSRNPHLYQRDVERVVNAILDQIIEALARGPGARASRAYTMHHRRLEVDQLRPSIPGSEALPGSPGCHQLKPATYVPCGNGIYQPSANCTTGMVQIALRQLGKAAVIFAKTNCF
jgi:hypothetical protein